MVLKVWSTKVSEEEAAYLNESSQTLGEIKSRFGLKLRLQDQEKRGWSDEESEQRESSQQTGGNSWSSFGCVFRTGYWLKMLAQ
jgi:hypothetical protein